MRSSDNRSSITRVAQSNFVSVTFPFSLPFSNGKVLGTRLSMTALLLNAPPQRRSFALRDKKHVREQDPIIRSEQLPYYTYVTAFLLTGLFLNTFQGNFPRENGISATSMNAFEIIRYHKRKRNVIKTNKLSFLGLQVLLTGLWDFKDILNSRQNRSKNKLVCENAVTRVHGSFSLQVMGSWRERLDIK